MAVCSRLSLSLVLLFLVACIASAKLLAGNKCQRGQRGRRAAVVVGNTNARCCPNLLGRLRFRAVAKVLEVCDGKSWLSVQMKDIRTSYGSQAYPGKSCKDILHKNKDHLPNGIYWIELQGAPGAFPVYCDMTSGGWTMVFKQVTGFPKQPVALWKTPFAINEFVLALLNPASTAKNEPYKNRLVQHWAGFKAAEARVVLYNQGKKAIHINFNARNSNNMNWFAFSRVTDSPWTDLATQPKNYFSIVGEPVHSRSFFINRNYGGCRNDAGWLVASNFRAGPQNCPWERFYKKPAAFLYSKIGGYTNWNKHANVGNAEVFTVFLR